jgi:hypothetical protein
MAGGAPLALRAFKPSNWLASTIATALFLYIQQRPSWRGHYLRLAALALLLFNRSRWPFVWHWRVLVFPILRIRFRIMLHRAGILPPLPRSKELGITGADGGLRAVGKVPNRETVTVKEYVDCASADYNLQ